MEKREKMTKLVIETLQEKKTRLKNELRLVEETIRTLTGKKEMSKTRIKIEQARAKRIRKKIQRHKTT